MVVKDEHDRILMTHEAASENGVDARQFLQLCKRPRPPGYGSLLGLCAKLHRSDQSGSSACPISSRPLPYGQESLGTPQKIAALLPPEGQGERTEQNDAPLLAVAKQLWKWRWSLLKKPANPSGEAKQAMAALEREEAGFVHRFRSIIRQLGNLFDSSQAKPKRSSNCNSCARRSTRWTTIICTRFSPSLTITGIRLCGICGKGDGEAPAWVKLRVGDAFAAQTGEKP